jgi:hypothetical protein
MSNSLHLFNMHERHRALTAAIAASYIEAARVCMSRYHSSPVQLALCDGSAEIQAGFEWLPPDDRTMAAWANEIDATEAAAYGCVIAGVEMMRGLLAVRRAETGTGADYYIGPAGAGVEDLENCMRLEVSGVGSGDGRDVRTRLLKKVQQAKDGKSSLPALAGVFGFFAKLMMLQDVA